MSGEGLEAQSRRRPAGAHELLHCTLWSEQPCYLQDKCAHAARHSGAQVFLVIAILMGEGLYMVSKVLYNSGCRQQRDYSNAIKPLLRFFLGIWRRSPLQQHGPC